MNLKSFYLKYHTPNVDFFEKNVLEYLKSCGNIDDLDIYDFPSNNSLAFVFKETGTRTDSYDFMMIGPAHIDIVLSSVNETLKKADEEGVESKLVRLVSLSKSNRIIAAILFRTKNEHKETFENTKTTSKKPKAKKHSSAADS